MKAFFNSLLEYNHHTNQKLIEAFIENKNKVSEKSWSLINHILNAHQIWNQRINAIEKTFGVWEMHPSETLLNIDLDNFKQSLAWIESLDFNTIITYKNSKGESFQNSLQDICFHIINHSTYHRGQIALEFKQVGIAPLITDYIFYKRK